jgi:hypothetical protein
MLFGATPTDVTLTSPGRERTLAAVVPTLVGLTAIAGVTARAVAAGGAAPRGFAAFVFGVAGVTVAVQGLAMVAQPRAHLALVPRAMRAGDGRGLERMRLAGATSAAAGGLLAAVALL